MELSPETKAMIGSAVRWVIPLVLGLFGKELSESQLTEAGAAITVMLCLGLSLYWSRKADAKIVAESPILPEQPPAKS